MGLFSVNIELINTTDLDNEQDGYITKDKIRRMNVNALVDSGAYLLCINEKVSNQLGLRKRGFQDAQLADGTIKKLEVVGPVEVCFLNRSTTTRAFVLPGESEVLLGSIPLEDLDVIIDPKEQTLKLPPDRPYIAQKSIK